MSWAYRQDEEWNRFVAGNAKGEGVLVFGRVTYEQMASYWPTPMAREHAPVVAKRMNELPKVVFSRKMEQAAWQNTTLLRGDLAQEVHKLKAQDGADLVILGSASLVWQLTEAGLIDGYQIAVNPVVLGGGKSMFAHLPKRVNLKLLNSRTFQNGTVFMTYQPA